MTNWLVRAFVRHPEDVSNPSVRQQYGFLSGMTGIFLNLCLSGGKFLVGMATGSIAVTADAFNNLSDAGSSVVTLAGFRMAAKKADRDHPFGHGRIEYLSGLAVSVLILLMGLELGRSSVTKIITPSHVFFSWSAVVILCASILLKLWMSAFNRSLSRRIGSAAMGATSTDSLTDAVATFAVLLGLLADHFAALSIDGWMGILVALFILRSGWSAARDTLSPLLGNPPAPELVSSIRDSVLSHPEISGIHDLVIHDYGPGRSMMSLHAEVSMDGDMLALHDVIDNVERELKEKFHTVAVIHMDPVATHDPQVLAMQDRVSALVREVDASMTIHDFRMTTGSDHRNLIFDVAAPYGCPLSDAQIREAIVQKATQLDGPNFFVISVDRTYAAP